MIHLAAQLLQVLQRSVLYPFSLSVHHHLTQNCASSKTKMRPLLQQDWQRPTSASQDQEAGSLEVPKMGSSLDWCDLEFPNFAQRERSRTATARARQGRGKQSRALTGSGGLPEDGLALLVVGLLDHVEQQQLVAGAQQVVRRPPQRHSAPLREVHRQPHPPLARAARRHAPSCWTAAPGGTVKAVVGCNCKEDLSIRLMPEDALDTWACVSDNDVFLLSLCSFWFGFGCLLKKIADIL
jgi:hypothetical protein